MVGSPRRCVGVEPDGVGIGVEPVGQSGQQPVPLVAPGHHSGITGQSLPGGDRCKPTLAEETGARHPGEDLVPAEVPRR